MKALFELFRRFDARRLFGFIRRLGGHVTSKSQVLRFAFYPRPLGGRRHQGISQKSNRVSDFYPRPPGGGRRGNFHGLYIEIFLSTPSGWRATTYNDYKMIKIIISIHALRVEGDTHRKKSTYTKVQFLSTPSGWRATVTINQQDQDAIFLSTPSGWRATPRSKFAMS